LELGAGRRSHARITEEKKEEQAMSYGKLSGTTRLQVTMSDGTTTKLAKAMMTEACKKAIEALIRSKCWNAEISEPQTNNLLIHVKRHQGGPLFFEIKIKESY
jgi:hypothetical protein